MSKFSDLKKEMKESISKGEKQRRHSKADFTKFAKEFVNDVEFEVTKVKGVDENDKPVVEKITPVKDYRKTLEKILEDFGVDKQEAAKMTTDYQIKSVDGMYEFVSELLYQYMETGKKFQFIQKEDFNGAIWVDDEEEDDDWKEWKNPRAKVDPSQPEYVYVKKKAHKKLNRSSKCPSWLKETKK